MKLKDVCKELNRLLEEGHGDCEVCFDVEAQSYDVHVVPVDSIGLVPKGIVTEKGYILLGEIK